MKSKYALHSDFSEIEDNGDMRISEEQHREEISFFNDICSCVHADGTTVSEESITLPGYQGDLITAKIYSPVDAKGLLPCLIFLHGGAFFLPMMQHHLQLAMLYAAEVPCKVILVDYRLSLDHPFPVPAEDCYESTQWIFKNSGVLGIDPKRVALMGDSAGGNLAAVLCLMARDRGGFLPCLQMLLFPVLDSRQNTPSVRKFIDTPGFNATGNEDMWQIYLKNGDVGMPQYAAPAMAKDLRGLPPAYIEAAEFDCLHDEDQEYAMNLSRAGVEVQFEELNGAFHGYDAYLDIPYTRNMINHRIEVLKASFY